MTAPHRPYVQPFNDATTRYIAVAIAAAACSRTKAPRRPEQIAEAEELIAVGNATMHTIAAAVGMTVEQVRELNAEIQRGAAS